MDLDRIDFDIIRALQKNSRLSNKELSAKIGLAPSTTHHRVKQLEQDGIIRGHRTEVSPKALGIGLQALISVQQGQHGKDTFRTLYKYVRTIPEVVGVYYISGVTDLVIHVAVRDVDHLRTIVEEKIAEREEVGRCETSVIYDHFVRNELPNLMD